MCSADGIPSAAIWCRSASGREARDEIVANIAKNLLWPLLIALPALGLLIWLGIDRAMRPLRLLNRQVEHRAPDNLVALDIGGAPAEVAPLVASLNRLFDRVDASIENERRFTADAAHELRTPLAALRAQAQVARGAGDDAERPRALDNVIAGCDRATHLVDQLLTLARLEPESFRAEREPCDLRELARLAVAEVVPAALAKTIEIELAGGPPVTVAGRRAAARASSCAISSTTRCATARRTRRSTCASASATAAPSSRSPTKDRVSPPDERERLGRRFHRLLGTGGIRHRSRPLDRQTHCENPRRRDRRSTRPRRALA